MTPRKLSNAAVNTRREIESSLEARIDMFWILGLGIGVVLLAGAFGLGQMAAQTDGSSADATEDEIPSSRRSFLELFGGGLAGLAGTWLVANSASAEDRAKPDGESGSDSYDGSDASAGGSGSGYPDSFEGLMSTTGKVDHEFNGFDPMEVAVDWDYGKVSTLSDGQTLREYEWKAIDKEIEVAPGVRFPAWTYEGRVPGPTIRCKEGDRIRIKFTNVGSHPHTIHFHGIHPFEMDGVPGAGPGEIKPGEQFTYEFDAEPFGCHFYHCHAVPLKRHIHKGLYGAFIVDPKEGRPPARELMMMMNGFDTNLDGDNEIYAVNSVAFEYARRPIPARVGETIRMYVINCTEFDPINSLHTHAEFFDYYDHGTSLEPDREQIDTVMQCQAQRGIVEVSYETPGRFMFHAHQSEFAELGWMAKFNVVEPGDFEKALREVGVGPDWDRLATDGMVT